MKLTYQLRFLGAMTVVVTLTAADGASDFTLEQRENFLRNASVVRRQILSMGVTGSTKALLDNGGIQHDAHIQTVDERRVRLDSNRGVELNFRDSYRYNVAAYELAKLLGLNMVPPSVVRRLGGKTGAVTWWVDNVAMTELERYRSKTPPPDVKSWEEQMSVVRTFDQLIYNTDRNIGNLVITKDWQIWMIDHTRAFRMHKVCANLNILGRVDRKLLERMRALTREHMDERLSEHLSREEIKSLLARRDQLLRHFDGKIAARGEDAVLFSSNRF